MLEIPTRNFCDNDSCIPSSYRYNGSCIATCSSCINYSNHVFKTVWLYPRPFQSIHPQIYPCRQDSSPLAICLQPSHGLFFLLAIWRLAQHGSPTGQSAHPLRNPPFFIIVLALQNPHIRITDYFLSRRLFMYLSVSSCIFLHSTRTIGTCAADVSPLWGGYRNKNIPQTIIFPWSHHHFSKNARPF